MQRHLPSILVLLVLGLSLLATGATRAAAGPIGVLANGTITGKVTSKTTGLPIADVHVTAELLPNAVTAASTTTTADGTYVLSVPPGTYVLGFFRSDLASVYYPNVPRDPAMGSQFEGQQFTIASSQTIPGVNVGLFGYGRAVVQPSSFTGYGSAIQLYRLDPVTFQHIVSGFSYAGAYVESEPLPMTYDRLAPGAYTARVVSPGYGLASTYLGGSPFPSAAATFAVNEFETALVDFVPQAGGVITGTVTPGNPAWDGDGYDPVSVIAIGLNPVTNRWEHVAGTVTDPSTCQFSLAVPRMPVRVGILGGHDGWWQFGGWGLLGGTRFIESSPDVRWYDDAIPSQVATGGLVVAAQGAGSGFCQIGGKVSQNIAYALDYYVQAYAKDASGAWKPVGIPDRFGGTYYTIDVPAGSYKLGFFMHGAEPVYNGPSYSLAAAPVLTVPTSTGGNLENVNVPLYAGYRCEFPAPDVAVLYSSKATVTMSAKSSMGKTAGGTSFTLQSSTDGKTWKNVKSVTTNASGTVSTVVAPPAPTVHYRLWNLKTYYTTEKSQVVRKRALLSTPSAPTKVRRGSSFSSSGYVGPRHATGSKAVRLYCYRYESGRWRLRKTVYASCSSRTSTTSTYRASLSLPYAGKWRIRAYHPADSVHVATYSTYRYLTAY